MQINIPTGGYIIKKSIALLCIIKINGYLLIWDNTSVVDTSVLHGAMAVRVILG